MHDITIPTLEEFAAMDAEDREEFFLSDVFAAVTSKERLPFFEAMSVDEHIKYRTFHRDAMRAHKALIADGHEIYSQMVEDENAARFGFGRRRGTTNVLTPAPAELTAQGNEVDA